jgi:hypothetical protein
MQEQSGAADLDTVDHRLDQLAPLRDREVVPDRVEALQGGEQDVALDHRALGLPDLLLGFGNLGLELPDPFFRISEAPLRRRTRVHARRDDADQDALGLIPCLLQRATQLGDALTEGRGSVSREVVGTLDGLAYEIGRLA